MNTTIPPGIALDNEALDKLSDIASDIETEGLFKTADTLRSLVAQARAAQPQPSAARQGQGQDEPVAEFIEDSAAPGGATFKLLKPLRVGAKLYAAPQPTAAPTPQVQPAGAPSNEACDEAAARAMDRVAADHRLESSVYLNTDVRAMHSLRRALIRAGFDLAGQGAAPTPHEQEARVAAPMPTWKFCYQCDGGYNGEEKCLHCDGEGTVDIEPTLAQPAHEREARAAVLEEVAKLIERKVESYDREHGSYDHTTGTTEYPGDGAEWVNEMTELADEIRLLPAAPSVLTSAACKVPPAGWRCTREPGHDGPCAAWPAPAQTGMLPVAQTDAASDVLAERRRQVEQEGGDK